MGPLALCPNLHLLEVSESTLRFASCPCIFSSPPGSGKRVEAAEVEERQRSDFIDSLVSEKAASAPIRTAQNGRQEPEKESTNSQEEEGGDWSQLEGSEQSGAQQRVGERLKEQLQARGRTAEYRKMLKDRLGLPIARVRDEILDALRRHDVVVVSGETGSGKTTQVGLLTG
jgi:HrpA-like RNA helicase